MVYSDEPENGDEKEKRMKDDYYKNFININFYGMQSKVVNPMTSPQWLAKAKKLSIEADKEKLLRI